MPLQQILGTDKRNPSFTIAREGSGGCLHVYYGGELFEKVPDSRDDPQYKLMVARLYNAGVNALVLRTAFGVDQKTMRRWGDALKSGEAQVLMRVLAGRQAQRKLTTEISMDSKRCSGERCALFVLSACCSESLHKPMRSPPNCLPSTPSRSIAQRVMTSTTTHIPSTILAN